MLRIINLYDAGSMHTILENDISIAPKCRFIGMYGSIYRGYEDHSEPCIESNIRSDIDAFKGIVKAPWQEFIISPPNTSSFLKSYT